MLVFGRWVEYADRMKKITKRRDRAARVSRKSSGKFTKVARSADEIVFTWGPQVRTETITMADPDSEWRKNPRLRAGYGPLADVLDKALNQAQFGKGNDRHNQNEERFEDQQIVQLGEWMGRSTVFGIGQACKKAIESTHLSDEKAIEELLGAINYLAAAVIVIQRRKR